MLSIFLLDPLGAVQQSAAGAEADVRAFVEMERGARLAALEAEIGEKCDSVTWTTTGIFVLSIFLTILRPDPTLAVCLFGFYGT